MLAEPAALRLHSIDDDVMDFDDNSVRIPFDVLEHEHGTRVDVFLSRRIKRMSRSLAQRIVRAGMVTRPNGEHVPKPSLRLFEGERILLARRKLVEEPVDDIVIPIVHEDARMVAVSKPADLVVHPTASAYRRTLVRILRARMGDDRLDLAHRIDKETSGLVILARDAEAASNLKGQFARRAVEKSYLAIVVGTPASDRFTVDAPMRLVPGSASGVKMEVAERDASQAETEFFVLARSSGHALLEARPKTGRQHQIRVHAMHAGHPLVGDKLYLGDESVFLRALGGEIDPAGVIDAVGHSRQALHAWRATFAHPDDGARLTLTAQPPEDFVDLALRLGLSIPDRTDSGLV